MRRWSSFASFLHRTSAWTHVKSVPKSLSDAIICCATRNRNMDRKTRTVWNRIYLTQRRPIRVQIMECPMQMRQVTRAASQEKTSTILGTAWFRRHSTNIRFNSRKRWPNSFRGGTLMKRRLGRVCTMTWEAPIEKRSATYLLTEWRGSKLSANIPCTKPLRRQPPISLTWMIIARGKPGKVPSDKGNSCLTRSWRIATPQNFREMNLTRILVTTTNRRLNVRKCKLVLVVGYTLTDMNKKPC